MDRVRLEQYLSGRLGEAVRITSLAQAFPGLSRETWLVRLERGRVGAAVEQGLVVRADSPGGPFPPVPLEYEYQVYMHLARTDIPVARPLWFDAAPELTDGRALFVRDLVEGSTLLPGLGDDTAAAAERRRRVAIEHIENLARLHRLDWSAAGFGSFMEVPASAEDATRANAMVASVGTRAHGAVTDRYGSAALVCGQPAEARSSIESLQGSERYR